MIYIINHPNQRKGTGINGGIPICGIFRALYSRLTSGGLARFRVSKIQGNHETEKKFTAPSQTDKSFFSEDAYTWIGLLLCLLWSQELARKLKCRQS